MTPLGPKHGTMRSVSSSIAGCLRTGYIRRAPFAELHRNYDSSTHPASGLLLTLPWYALELRSDDLREPHEQRRATRIPRVSARSSILRLAARSHRRSEDCPA